MSGMKPPDDAVAVYAGFWHGAARAMRVAVVLVAAASVAVGIAAVRGGAAAPVIGAVLVIALAVVARSIYDTEPVFASRAGLLLRRDGAWRSVPWARVGEAKRVPYIVGPVHIVHLRVDGEPRPVKFFAYQVHEDALRRLREKASSLSPV